MNRRRSFCINIVELKGPLVKRHKYTGLWIITMNSTTISLTDFEPDTLYSTSFDHYKSRIIKMNI